MEAQLRRVKKFSAPPAQKQQLSCGDLVLDRDEFTVTAGGSPVTLTAREFEILALLMEYPKKVFRSTSTCGGRTTSGTTTPSTSTSATCAPSWARSVTGSISRPSGASALKWRRCEPWISM